MLKPEDRHYAKKRKRVWDIFHWGYSGINYLSKNHSLNCGCSMCKARTYFRRLKNKQERRIAKQALKQDINQI